MKLKIINCIGGKRKMKVDGMFYSYKKNEEFGYDESLQKCIESTCQYCIDNTYMSSDEKIKRPIMMLGKIQSGKTRAFTGLIALAFDNDFDMVFILTKNSKALVQQTVTRMKNEFKPFIEQFIINVTDIMKANSRISGYQLEQKNILIAKKEKNNINRLIDFIKDYSINQNKKCLIIDDEADTTGIGYYKVKGENEYTLRMVSSKVNEMRGTLDGCVFVQVTATPYALYLQPDFQIEDDIQPIRPLNTILVPHGDGYIGGDYYFIKSKVENHPASFLFEPMSDEEHELISNQKRKGKKSKLEDRRSFKEEEIIVREDRLTTFKKGLVNFMVGVIVLRHNEERKKHYAYVIHTATQKGSHMSLQSIAEIFFEQIRERDIATEKIINKMLKESYEDIKKSVLTYGIHMPEIDYISKEFYYAIDKEYYSIDVVNSDNDLDILLNEETGELKLATPFSIFVGGQVLDRGVTIRNMVGFYYGRNPKTMQQDTVLQHSRMFGYRKEFLPVTRFYTTHRIYSNMEKITEIDIALREDIENEKQGNGVYFITRKTQDTQYGNGYIRPCSPDKIRVSDIIFLKEHKRILPIGFTPVIKAEYARANNAILHMLEDAEHYNKDTYVLPLQKAIEMIRLVYSTIYEDKESNRFINEDEFITLLRYFTRNNDDVFFTIHLEMNIGKKYKNDGKLQDSPDTSKTHLKQARYLAVDSPCIMLFQETSNDKSWKGRSFWWPVMVAPKYIPKTIFAAKEVGEKVV